MSHRHALVDRSCRLYARLLLLYPARLCLHYGDEIEALFRQQMLDGSAQGVTGIARVWLAVARETVHLLGPACLERLGLLTASTLAASALVLAALLGFCSLQTLPVVHGFVNEVPTPAARITPSTSTAHRVATSRGQLFLECVGEPSSRPTVILATGRGIGDHTGWAPVQSRLSTFAHVCSYDPLGAGESDRTPSPHAVQDVVADMHALFEAAHLAPPYLMVGTSLGGVLVRRYQQQYPAEIAGLVFVDSSHEEMEWRDAAIAPGFDPSWNDPRYLQENGLLPARQTLTWHTRVPLIVLERAETPPCSAFPGLTQTQCDAINAAWHSFQVDLVHRASSGELRTITGAGHAMALQKPDAVAAAIRDVLDRIHARPSTTAAAIPAVEVAEQQYVIEAVSRNLQQNYLDPEVARRMVDALQMHWRNGDDNAATDGAAFAGLLTRQMQEVSYDRHVVMEYSSATTPDRPPGPTPEGQARYRSDMARTHCTIERAEILPHNIGYLKINEFPDPPVCRATVMAAMQQLNHVDAIVFDLRDNHGGNPDMVALIASYLFDRPTHLIDIVNHAGAANQHSWTQSPIPGNRLADKPAFVLTSASTFSGAEEFCYVLKVLHRATLVGETTAGGAHMGSWHRLDAHFGMGVPDARPVSPVTHSDWEGTGILPDIPLKSADALEEAEKLAADKLSTK